MSKNTNLTKKILEAQKILEAMGLDKPRRNEMAALTLLALAEIKPNGSWVDATKASTTISNGIMAFVSKHYKKTYAANTRETFRRQVLHQFEQAGVVDYNPDIPDLPVTSPRAHYALTKKALAVLTSFGTKTFSTTASKFKKLTEKKLSSFQKIRDLKRIPLVLPNGQQVSLSPGKHNEVAVAVIQHFSSRFAHGATLLYLGDTEEKEFFFNKEDFRKIGVTLKDNGKLPDLILLQIEKKWLYLIEVVTSHGPVSQKRVIELTKIFSSSGLGLIFVTAFPNISEFKKHANDIAWDTEVWLADTPDHLIHFNGDRFVGPR
jgi:hypothetical protein